MESAFEIDISYWKVLRPYYIWIDIYIYINCLALYIISAYLNVIYDVQDISLLSSTRRDYNSRHR